MWPFKRKGYSKDEQRVADYITANLTGIGTGVDPIGFLIASHSSILGTYRKLRKTQEAAQNLYDNRLGHRYDEPLWSAPQGFWIQLGKVLDETRL